ncbi:fumarylacetoacetate hydrolase family protein [Paeniglutamicibacter cryotolerans]|uniref:2-keto-4-pentenoate hydratase/2-oxohepta-3-ene-1,7-dioic acid hydratase in catechol pathway/regulator of RNase E activity RraA n=1 Tax=Paeniglutamicibacter cryotolerans TaxID=670079 RepID=A0A839QR19_9MICC|nr:fumarylacetoacetate hydrolase family protein [Paeniglutamicibacter cryotolerans]MBB2996436.1 2-keto-4-pentenoate hydratase/2-oxohepta-3-ene-1,7-dioic acid hydratase in catechol pathway/regulator of RNase E activity RraA [Paeniglutamicibacter cryotolerans]
MNSGNEATTIEGLTAVDQSVLDQAGKVLAVHLSYSSRAAQRGRTPAFPSYFMKASSSLSVSGTPVERPAGTELLAFEGEIALVIGTKARRVSVEEAWSHVGAVTASNDLGVYDIKYADKGSNIRSKSGDGFTPMGPVLLPADKLNPAALRIRTWVNGILAQDASTEELIFSFAQIVADLSQQMTLLPGDVILTGTPAGSSVIVPGDVVEIQVDDEAAGLSTGRLSTPVTQGTEAFAAFGNQPKITDTDRIDAFGTAAAAGIEVPVTGKSALTEDVKAKLMSVATATISGALRKRGLNNVSVDGLQATKGMKKVIGTARTLRYVPNREDLFKTHGGGYNAQKRVIDDIGPGEILVMEARGEKGSGTLGDILAMRTQVRGAEAIITDGGVRDLDAVAALEIPTFHNGAHPAVLGRKHVPWDIDVAVGCGGTTIVPGDIVIADADGILVIPPHLAAEIAEEVVESERQDTFVFNMVTEGNKIEGLFPMNAEWKARYNEWVAAGGDQ